MEKAQRVAGRFGVKVAGELRHRGVDFGQRCCAQEKARRKPLVGAAQYAAGVVSLDQTFDMDGQVRERAMGQNVGDVAERVLMHVEA